jgi:hypothetical protein
MGLGWSKTRMNLYAQLFRNGATNARAEATKEAAAILSFRPELKSPFSDRAAIYAIRAICLLGLVLANYYGWTMTVTGFVNTRLLPDNSVLPNTYIPHIVGGFVQLGILAFYLSIPYFTRRRAFLCSAASCLAVSLIALSALFALFSVTLTSQSESIVSHRTERARGMNKKIFDLDDLISTTFKNHVKDLDDLAERASQGKDESGINKRGPIYKGYITKANNTRAKFGAQLGAPGAYPKLDSTNIMDNWTSLRSSYGRLSQKVDAYKTFAKENNLSSEAVTTSFEAVGREIESFGASLNQRNPDAKTLVMTRVLDDLGRAFTLTAEPLFYFTLMIAVLPDLLSITFTALLLIARTANHRVMLLRREINESHEEAAEYRKFANATDELSNAKQEYRAKKRMANVTEAVDQSVPDVFD